MTSPSLVIDGRRIPAESEFAVITPATGAPSAEAHTQLQSLVVAKA